MGKRFSKLGDNMVLLKHLKNDTTIQCNSIEVGSREYIIYEVLDLFYNIDRALFQKSLWLKKKFWKLGGDRGLRKKCKRLNKWQYCKLN